LKRQKIEELLKYIEDRMSELEEEKEELRLYHEADKTRRCLEYTIYQREQNDIHTQLEELENDHMMETEGSHQGNVRIADRDRLISDMEGELKSTKQTLDVQRAERQQLQKEREDLVKLCARLELIVGDCEESSKSNKAERKALERELKQIEQEISRKEKKLSALYPQYEMIAEQDRRLREEFQKLDEKRDLLSSKQGWR
jgi:structural maintenance of chromosome 3 (chondroitin sulfate proteoglycan 6)